MSADLNSPTLENPALAAALQGVRFKDFIWVRQFDCQCHRIALDPTRVNRRSAISLLIHSNRSGMFSVVSSAPVETTPAVDGERPVYRAVRTIVLDRG